MIKITELNIDELKNDLNKENINIDIPINYFMKSGVVWDYLALTEKLSTNFIIKYKNNFNVESLIIGQKLSSSILEYEVFKKQLKELDKTYYVNKFINDNIHSYPYNIKKLKGDYINLKNITDKWKEITYSYLAVYCR